MSKKQYGLFISIALASIVFSACQGESRAARDFRQSREQQDTQTTAAAMAQ